MAGKFTNTTYTKTIDSLVQATKGNLKNPYYMYSDKKPTKVTYYKQNLERTTLDPASGLNYTHIGHESPIRFNKILEFYVYGFDQITKTVDVGDFGLEADSIDGECIILPNTIRPTMGDYFKVDQISEDVLFRVNAVNEDTLDNGSNFFQIGYKLDRTQALSDLEGQVVATYRCIINNVGTDFKCIIEETSYELIGQLEGLLEQLTDAYQLFFDPKVQNFLYQENGYHFYDPYLIEFMMRNGIMTHGREYIFVHHGCAVPHTFAYEYTKTIWYLLENPDALDRRTYYNLASAVEVKDINSLFITRLQPVYALNYNDPNKLNSRFEVLPTDVLNRCRSGELYTDLDAPCDQAWNLMIAFFQGNYDYIQDSMIDLIKYIDYTTSKSFYYLIPINIFIITAFISHLMQK